MVRHDTAASRACGWLWKRGPCQVPSADGGPGVFGAVQRSFQACSSQPLPVPGTWLPRAAQGFPSCLPRPAWSHRLSLLTSAPPCWAPCLVSGPHGLVLAGSKWPCALLIPGLVLLCPLSVKINCWCSNFRRSAFGERFYWGWIFTVPQIMTCNYWIRLHFVWKSVFICILLI